MSLTNIQDINNEILLSLNDDIIFVLNKHGELLSDLFWIRRFTKKYGASLVKYGVNHKDLYKKWKGRNIIDIFLMQLTMIIFIL